MLLIAISPAPRCCCFCRPTDAPQRTRRSTRAGRLPHRNRLPFPGVPTPLARPPKSPKSAMKRIFKKKQFIINLESIKKDSKGDGGKFLCTTKNAQSVWMKTFPYQMCNSKCRPCSRSTDKYCQSSVKIFGSFSQILYSPTGRPSNVSRGWKVFLAKYKSWSTLE